MITDQCFNCKHYWGVFSCNAYPNGNIPTAIATGLHDHTKPFKGDNGVRFELWTENDEPAEIVQAKG